MEQEHLLNGVIGDDTFLTISAYEKTSSERTGNFTQSPFSAETILTLAGLGGKGDTYDEIRVALAHLYCSEDRIKQTFRRVLSILTTEEYYTLVFANKIYVKRPCPLKPDFREMAMDCFNSDVDTVDFSNVAQAVESINEWVQNRTDGKICNLLSPEVISVYTRLVLVNAIYFRAEWVKPFERPQTCDRPFFRADGDEIQVRTMESTSHYNYYEYVELNARFLELQLKGGASMTIILPNEKNGIGRLENHISLAFTALEYSQEQITVRLPKFRVESTIDFRSIIATAGVVQSFNEETADFSGIAGQKGDLFLNSVIQKSFIDVCEEGIEAAAASAAEFCVPRCAFISEGPPREFNVDRPFIFYIKIKTLIVFTGRVTDPTAN